MNWLRRGAAAAAVEPVEPCLPEIWMHDFGAWGKQAVEEKKTSNGYTSITHEVHVQWRSCKLCGLAQKRKVNFV